MHRQMPARGAAYHQVPGSSVLIKRKPGLRGRLIGAKAQGTVVHVNC
jgi:hypothetical protein